MSDSLPADFDPAVYLELYPDVAAAKMDAAHHYLVHGRKEGRFYKPAHTLPNQKFDRVSGPYYFEYLAYLHRVRQPRTYLEIGTFAGGSLRLSNCASVAIDPRFKLGENVVGDKPACLLFQSTSDAFFERYDVKALLGGSIDLAFIDGMHLFENVLRDFINVERHISKDGLIVLHDCLPPEFYMTLRDRHDPRRPEWSPPSRWAGDVWRIIPALRRYRPELRLEMLDCQPTGLVVVSGLDPASAVLADSYAAITAVTESPQTIEEFEQFWSSIEVIPTASGTPEIE